MSAALKIAGLASGFGLFSASLLFTMKNSKYEFSKEALSLDHISETRRLPKPQVPSNLVPVSIGGTEIKVAA